MKIAFFMRGNDVVIDIIPDVKDITSDEYETECVSQGNTFVGFVDTANGSLSRQQRTLLEVIELGILNEGNGNLWHGTISYLLREAFTQGVQYQPKMYSLKENLDTDSLELFTLLGKKIEELGLDVRSYNALNRANVLTVGQIIVKEDSVRRPNGIMSIPNLGRRSRDNIASALHQLGLTYDMQIAYHENKVRLVTADKKIIEKLSDLTKES